MPQIVDARGNEFQGQLDQIGNQTVVDARTSSFTLGALNAEVVMDLNGKAVMTFDARTAAGNLTYVCEGTVDGTNYMALPMFAQFQLLVAAAVAEQFVPSVVIATTHSGIYTVGVSGFRRVRIRVSAYTSGNVTISPRASIADFIIYKRPIPATRSAAYFSKTYSAIRRAQVSSADAVILNDRHHIMRIGYTVVCAIRVYAF